MLTSPVSNFTCTFVSLMTTSKKRPVARTQADFYCSYILGCAKTDVELFANSRPLNLHRKRRYHLYPRVMEKLGYRECMSLDQGHRAAVSRVGFQYQCLSRYSGVLHNW